MDNFANSARGVSLSRVRWWTERARQAGVRGFPFATGEAGRAAALLKDGGYRSARLDLVAIRKKHK
eukprot:11200268-Lingulodinium_polyedra.AAC.1